MGKMLLPVVLVLFWLLAGGGAVLGEEGFLPMRGESPEGKPQINRFQFSFGGVESGANRSEGRTPSATAGDWVGWTEHCVRQPLMIGGDKIAMDAAAGFSLAAPLVRPDGGYGLLPENSWSDGVGARLDEGAVDGDGEKDLP